jgi:hypothetical protein
MINSCEITVEKRLDARLNVLCLDLTLTAMIINYQLNHPSGQNTVPLRRQKHKELK